MKVLIHKFQGGPRSGERLPLASGQDGLGLDPHISAWSVARRSTLTPSSRENALYDLIALRLWARITSLPLEERMLHGETIDPSEVRDLVYHLHLRTEDLRILAGDPALDLPRFYDRCKRISTQAFLRRTSTAWDYLDFLGAYGNRMVGKGGKPDPHLMELRRGRLARPARTNGRLAYVDNSIAKDLLGRRPRARQSRLSTVSTSDLEEFALALVQMDRTAVWPSNRHRALRNEIILRIFIETGMRSGELRQAKIEDLRPRDRKIEIPRRHNDPDSRGRRGANAKTFDGAVPMDESTWDLLMDWLSIHEDISEEVREESPFLFINLDRNPQHRGQQMSSTAVDGIVKDLCGHAGLPSLSPHPLRHLRARRLVDLIRSRNLTHEQARKAITYLMRWSDDSEMLAHYLGDHADAGAEQAMGRIHADRGFSLGGDLE